MLSVISLFGCGKAPVAMPLSVSSEKHQTEMINDIDGDTTLDDTIKYAAEIDDLAQSYYADSERTAYVMKNKDMTLVHSLKAKNNTATLYNNDGKVLLAEKPTLLNMEGGETVYNGDETKKMLKGDLKILERADSPLLRAFNSYTPDDIMNRFGGVSIPNYSSGISSAVANSKIVNNNNKPTLTINGGINVTCPAVTSKEVMNQVSTALQREFSGMALDAYQRANITR